MSDGVTVDNNANPDYKVVTDEITSPYSGAVEQAQAVKLLDGTADGVTVIKAGGGVEANALRVTIATDSTGVLSVDDNGGSLTVDNGGTFAVQDSDKIADNAAFTDGTSKVQPVGFILDETAGTALSENDIGAARMDSKRAVVGVIEDATTRGRRATVSAGGALLVDGTATTQPVSGTVTVNAGSGTFTVGDGGGSVSVDDNGSTLSIDDGGGSITVDGSVTVASGPAAARTTDSISSALATDAIMNNETVLTPKYATVVASASGATTIVAAVASKKIRVLSWTLVCNAAVNVKWQSHVTPTDKTGLHYFAANGGISVPFSPVGHFETVAGEALDINLSGAVAVGGSLVYVEV